MGSETTFCFCTTYLAGITLKNSSKFSVRIEAQVRENGEIRCSHKIIDGGELPSGGLVQAGHVLLVETLRAESYLMLLSKLSMGEEFSQITPKDLEGLVSTHFMQNLERLLPAIAQETLRRVSP